MSTHTQSTIKLVPTTKSQKITQTRTDTFEVTQESVMEWKNPPFQRALKINKKVAELAEEIKESEIIPGVITLATLGKDTYLLDGQHRREAFKLSAIKSAYVDVRLQVFETMADMGEEFVNLNSRLVNMKPDDILRGLEPSSEFLKKIRKACPYVGYDMIRRSEKAPILSMSVMLRCWRGATKEVPDTGETAANILKTATDDEIDGLIRFVTLCFNAWGRDPEYAKLWGALNLTLCAWIYRNTVLQQFSPRSPKLTGDMFQKCMMSVSASGSYLDWLVGRQLRDKDRSPAYNKLKGIITKRLAEELGKKVAFPQPAWAAHTGK